MRYQTTATLLASLGLGAFAQTKIEQTCVTNDVCYKLNIPQETVQNGQNGGNVFLSLSAPTTYSWVGLGIGSSMTNANMFIMYTDGNGNVTLSPRFSQGESQPQYINNLDVELLSGSGVANGVMTANFRCGNCSRSGSTNFGAQSGRWIHARKSGAAMDSTDVRARFSQHDEQGGFTWMYTNAIGGASANPFTASDAAVSGSAPANSSGGGGSSSPMRRNILLVHGIFASLAFLVFFPIGAIFMRLGKFNNVVAVHVATQVFAWLLFITAFGLGLYYGITGNYMSEAHPIIGLVLVALLLVQPLAGWLHHRQFLRTGQRSAVSHGHIWIGRVAIILGMINGGLGLQLGGSFTIPRRPVPQRKPEIIIQPSLQRADSMATLSRMPIANGYRPSNPAESTPAPRPQANGLSPVHQSPYGNAAFSVSSPAFGATATSPPISYFMGPQGGGHSIDEDWEPYEHGAQRYSAYAPTEASTQLGERDPPPPYAP
ncbi:hypothetical protein E8E12_006600 [Didymella heteroderae]|uniref:DOMON domain-containing protein n=1 Tax=Didymella heteroderae TaxID=1769908 RepID=A0A9P4WTB6_9PLEO|nr:hypothetical protein E8E12_006600 [Didymella heteroderae]